MGTRRDLIHHGGDTEDEDLVSDVTYAYDGRQWMCSPHPKELRGFKWGRNATLEGTTTVHSNTSQSQLSWGTWMGIMNYHVCMNKGEALR